VRANGEHQHDEAHVAEELHRWIRRVDRVEPRAPDDHTREDLPIRTGTNALRLAPGSGPARPASTINASTPKDTVPGYAALSALSATLALQRISLQSLVQRTAAHLSAALPRGASYER
jgi:hypothetical protein